MDKPVTILGCPICGKEPYVRTRIKSSRPYSIGCIRCGIEGKAYVRLQDDANRWNTRAENNSQYTFVDENGIWICKANESENE